MLRIFLVFSLVFCVFALPSHDGVGVGRNTAEVISYFGYQAESHTVTTEDGYILGMQRIPYKRGETTGPAGRPVVFLMHGLMSASYAFVILGPEYSMAYNLADAGFDVWMGNARGNKNSRSHVTLDPDANKNQFFDYTWEEVALYDVTAMVDYILDFTGKEKLHYIGHSQGGTVFLVLNSMKLEYNDKFASAHLLAPAGYKEHFPNGQLATLALMTDIIYPVTVASGNIEVNPPVVVEETAKSSYFNKFDNCFGDIQYKSMCELIGVRNYLRDDNAPEFADMGGGSLKLVAHFGQNIRDRTFRRWNYGSLRNQQIYGTRNPPAYNLSLITVNTVFHYTLNDSLVGVMDVLAMAEDVPNSEVRKVARDSFLHEDFATAPDVKDLVTDYMIDTMMIVELTLYPESNNNQDSGDDINNENNSDQENNNESNEDNENDSNQDIAAPIVGETPPTPVPGSSSVTNLSLAYKITLIVLGLKYCIT